MNWFKNIRVSNNELQAELKALVCRVIAQQDYTSNDMERYEKLLKEIFLRGLKPESKLRPREEK